MHSTFEQKTSNVSQVLIIIIDLHLLSNKFRNLEALL